VSEIRDKVTRPNDSRDRNDFSIRVSVLFGSPYSIHEAMGVNLMKRSKVFNVCKRFAIGA